MCFEKINNISKQNNPSLEAQLIKSYCSCPLYFQHTFATATFRPTPPNRSNRSHDTNQHKQCPLRMELELTRVDYTVVGITSPNCMKLLPPSHPQEQQKVTTKPPQAHPQPSVQGGPGRLRRHPPGVLHQEAERPASLQNPARAQDIVHPVGGSVRNPAGQDLRGFRERDQGVHEKGEAVPQLRVEHDGERYLDVRFGGGFVCLWKAYV